MDVFTMVKGFARFFDAIELQTDNTFFVIFSRGVESGIA